MKNTDVSRMVTDDVNIDLVTTAIAVLNRTMQLLLGFIISQYAENPKEV
jgi:hypothetical protein